MKRRTYPWLVSLCALISLLAPVSRVHAADYTAANEDIWPSQNDIAQTAGNGKKLLENQWQEAIVAITEAPNFVYSGCTVPASDADLTIDVAACQALISGRFVDIPGATAVTASASATNHLFLKLTRDGSNLVTGASFEVNTTGTQPADSIRLGRLIAGGSAITSTNQDSMPRGLPRAAKGPVGVASGSTRSHEGSVTISSGQNLSGIHFYTDFTLNSGVTITVPAGKRRLIIMATGTITINGTINASGAGATGSAGPNYVGGLNGTDGDPGTDQPGGSGGNFSSSGISTGAGGSALIHGVVAARGGAAQGGNGAGTAGTPLTGSDVPWPLLNAMGGAGGSGSVGNSSAGGTGGNGGGSIVLIAPTVVLGSTATLNTSGAAGDAGTSGYPGAGGGGAGNLYVYARSYTDNGATFTQAGGAGGAASIYPAGGAGANGVKQILLH